LLARLVHLAAGDRQEVSIETIATRIKIGHSSVGEIVARSDHDVFAFVTLYEVQVYRLSDGKHLRTLPTRLGMATALALTPDARYLACHFLGDVQIWDLHRGEVVARIELLD